MIDIDGVGARQARLLQRHYDRDAAADACPLALSFLEKELA